jgi:hypothetical protein
MFVLFNHNCLLSPPVVFKTADYAHHFKDRSKTSKKRFV